METARPVHYTRNFMGKTLRRYLLREIGAAFLAGIAVFSSILFLLRTVDLIEMIFARGVPAALAARLLAAILPSFLEATLPMAFLLGIVIALRRMASDHEVLALRAAGLSVWQMLPPLVALSLLIAASTLALSMTARPWGHREIERTVFEIAKTRATAALRPRFFNTDFERMVVYVDRIDAETGDLFGVLLSDERGKAGRSTVFAKKGKVGGHRDSGSLFLQLFDGTSVTTRDNAADYDMTKFRSLDVNLELRTATGNRSSSDEPATLLWGEIREQMASQNSSTSTEATIELHRRLSIAASTIALALLGVGLGFQPSRGSPNQPVGMAIGAILALQGLLALAVALARSNSFSPVAVLWSPIVLLTIAALWVLSRSAHDIGILGIENAPRRPQGGGSR